MNKFFPLARGPVCVLLLLLLVPAARAQERPRGWRAGVAKAVITPRQPTWMSGYAGRDRPAEEKVHDLWAKALALEDADGKRALLVTLDLVGIDRDTSKTVCAEIERRYKLPRSAVMLTVSHTHCGPVVGSNLRAMYFLDETQQKRVDDYTKYLRESIVSVAGAALENL